MSAVFVQEIARFLAPVDLPTLPRVASSKPQRRKRGRTEKKQRVESTAKKLKIGDPVQRDATDETILSKFKKG